VTLRPSCLVVCSLKQGRGIRHGPSAVRARRRRLGLGRWRLQTDGAGVAVAEAERVHGVNGEPDDVDMRGQVEVRVLE